jgi:hypothetical protein
MTDKICVIIASSDRRVIKTALQYARRTVTEKFMTDTKVFLFGPSEEVIAYDAELQDFLKRYMDVGKEVLACKWCSDDCAVSDALTELGVKVEYIGVLVSQAIEQGYVPMVW